MKKSRRILWAILATLFMGGSIGGAFLLYFFLFTQKIQPQVVTKLEEVDRHLSRGYLDLAKQELTQLFEKTDSSYSLLRVLKRMVQLVRYTQDWRWLNTYTSKVYQARPGNEDIAFIAAYTAFNARQLEEARTIVNKTPVPEQLAPLRLAALLTLEPAPGLQQATLLNEARNEDKELVSILFTKDPVLFEKAGLKEQDHNILLDAALLYMQAGDIQKAYLLVKENLHEFPFDEPAAAISYEAGDYELARKRLNALYAREQQRKDLLLFIADTWLLEKRYEDAKMYYQLVMNNIPGFSIHPYINLAWILQQEDRREDALTLLNQGLTLFPNDDMGVCETARLQIRLGYEGEVVPLLQAYLKKEPDNAEVWFMLLSLESKTLLPAYFQARLWQLFERYPTSADLCEYLFWHLLKARDYEKASLILDIYTKAYAAKLATAGSPTQGEPEQQLTRGTQSTTGSNTHSLSLPVMVLPIQLDWYLHLTGILCALKGPIKTQSTETAAQQASEAVSYLSKSLAIKETSHVRYNRAVLYKFLKDYPQAREDIRQALADSRLENKPAEKNKTIFLSKVHTLLGELLFLEGSAEKARTEWLYALEISPENAAAKFLLKKLEKTK